MLHTWTRQLFHDPHVHYVVPGVALASDGTLIFGATPEFFLPVQVLSAHFRPGCVFKTAISSARLALASGEAPKEPGAGSAARAAFLGAKQAHGQDSLFTFAQASVSSDP